MLAWAALGLALGLLHFALLRWNTRLYLEGRRFAPLLQAARILAVAAVFVPLARLGAWPVLLAMGGFLIGRGLILRRARAA